MRLVLALLMTIALFLQQGGGILRAAASPPTLTAPTDGEQIASLGPTLTWESPAGATQYHLQVIPANNDGPGVDLHVGSPDTSFTIPAPPNWYGLLPGMTYTWRVRVSDASTFVGLTDESWSGWSERHFRTPVASSATISLRSPSSGAAVSSLTPLLEWTNSRSDIFYYEVQVSKDPAFGPNAFLYHELRHGGVTQPPNSYRVPAAFPLEANTTYAWRVRPRVQGDGAPVTWSATGSFTTQSATASPTPTPSPSPGPSPSPTATPGTDGPPALSGERIAFVSDRSGPKGIFVVRPDGTGLFNLTGRNHDEAPAWSADGKKLLMVSSRDQNQEIYVIDADGSNLLRLTNNTAADYMPAFSPDGSRVAFVSNRDGSAQVYVMRVDGTGVTKVSTVRQAHWDPRWSPDGSKLLYGSNREGKAQIIMSNADGTGETNLTNTSSNEYGFSWSPDGRRIAFTSTREGNSEIYVMDAQGGAPTNVTKHPGPDYQAVWSPDGRKISFISEREGNLEVFVINPDGSQLINLSNSPAKDCFPATCLPRWSSDSSKVTFVSERDGNQEVYVVNADGTGLRRLAGSPGDDNSPVWSPR